MANWRRLIFFVGVPIAAIGAIQLYRNHRRGVFGQLATNVREFDMPSARVYDALAGSGLTWLYARVAGQVAAMRPSGVAVEIGSGPGHLAVLLARAVPDLKIIGVDISPSMVEIANKRAAKADVADRVRFEVGDVSALPFADMQVNLVVSTLSMHHWPDPAAGLREIYRVLVPGGQAVIYDVPTWVVRVTHLSKGFGLARGAAAISFGGGEVDTAVGLGPIAIIQRLRLRKRGD